MNIEELKKPLDPKHVNKPSGKFGPKGDYLEGWHVINELNRICGFDGWSYTIDLSKDALEQGKNGKGDLQWQAAYTCVCTLTIQTDSGNIVRQDVGFGSGFAKQIGDAIEGATKEAVTDALKRAARTLGNPFGLALYDKSRANVQAPPVELPTGPINEKTQSWIEAQVQTTGKPMGDFLKAMDAESTKALTYEKMEDAKAWVRDNRSEA